MSKRYEVKGEDVGTIVCWEDVNVSLSELLNAAKTEFVDVSFDDLEIAPGEDGEYLFLQHRDRFSEQEGALTGQQDNGEEEPMLDLSDLYQAYRNQLKSSIQKSGQ